MKNMKNLEIKVNDLIALCYMIDDFDEFYEHLMKLKQLPNYHDIIFDIIDITNGKFGLKSLKAKSFYKKNKKVIEIINKYSTLDSFMFFSNYDSLYFMHQYLLKNKDKLNHIKLLLKKIELLGFEELQFNEKLDFTLEECKLRIIFGSNTSIKYMDNIETIPSYDNFLIKYKTANSNYQIIVEPLEKDLSKYNRTIILNSLLFDINSLPDKISKEVVYDSIINTYHKQTEACKMIRNAVDLSLSVANLDVQYSRTMQVISSLNGVKNKQKLLQILEIIKTNITKLSTMCDEYDNDIVDTNEFITPTLLHQEKMKYLDKKY